MFDFEFIRDNWLFITMGLGMTLGVTLSSFLLATPLAIIVAKGRRSAFLPINALSTFYVWLLDGIPLLLQIFFIFLALPQLGIFLPGFWAAVFVLTVYYSAHMSNIFNEHFASSGNVLSPAREALIPAIANAFIAMIKDSTLIATTGFIHDIFWRATKVGRAEFKTLEALTVAAAIYLILNTLIAFSLGARKVRLPIPE